MVRELTCPEMMGMRSLISCAYSLMRRWQIPASIDFTAKTSTVWQYWLALQQRF